MEHDHKDCARGHRAMFEASGEEWTPLRAAVFNTMSDTPLSAYDIAEAVSQQLHRRVAANTVYRILALFMHHGIVKRIESANTYVVSAHPEARGDCIFLVCDTCGQATHVDSAPVSEQVRALALATGFVPDRPVIEVRGRCAQCA